MIGLDFVKKMDKDWEKNISRVYVRQYNEDYCPNCGDVINII